MKNFKFPNISRIITENKIFKKLFKLQFRLLKKSKHKRIILYFLTVSAIITIFLLFIINFILGAKLYKYIKTYSVLTVQRQEINRKINFWQSFTQKYDSYKDAYFQIALLEYQLGNFEKAKEYNKQALLLDPGFEDAKNLEVLLENK